MERLSLSVHDGYKFQSTSLSHWYHLQLTNHLKTTKVILLLKRYSPNINENWRGKELALTRGLALKWKSMGRSKDYRLCRPMRQLASDHPDCMLESSIQFEVKWNHTVCLWKASFFDALHAVLHLTWSFHTHSMLPSHLHIICKCVIWIYREPFTLMQKTDCLSMSTMDALYD